MMIMTTKMVSSIDYGVVLCCTIMVDWSEGAANTIVWETLDFIAPLATSIASHHVQYQQRRTATRFLLFPLLALGLIANL